MMNAWLLAIMPEIILAASVVLLLPLGPLLPARHRSLSTWLALGALAAAAVTSVPLAGRAPRSVFDGVYAVDLFAIFFKFIALATTALVLLVTRDSFRGRRHEASVPTLLVLTCLGLVTLAASQSLVLIALFLALITVGSYVLVGIAKEERLATEGALKLFLFGSVATMTMFYGMALLYGLTGTLILAEIASALPAAPRIATAVALAFILAGYGFKVTLVPFQFWAPDTYEGAPTAIAAFLSVGPKAAGLAVLLRTLAVAAPAAIPTWTLWTAIVAALTMTAGNLLALRQSNVKRLLAYSSIAQAGYLLMGIASYGRDPLAVPGMLFYLAAYLAMNLAAFLTVAAIGSALGSDDVARYAGLGRRMPAAAFALTVSLLALAGIPPMASFIGKAMLFGAALGARLEWLAVVAAVNTAISLVYYVRVLDYMYLRPEGNGASGRTYTPFPLSTTIAVVIASVLTLALGIFPQPLAGLLAQTPFAVGLLPR